MRALAESLNRSTWPVSLVVLDNGKDKRRAELAISTFKNVSKIVEPAEPLGVAASWNWFIDNVPEERIICNDDVTFGPTAVHDLVMTSSDLALVSGLGFACYLIRDSCVEIVGKFDEEISPGYGYYEDEDYLQRIDGRGTRARMITMEDVPCDMKHTHSGTLKAATAFEIEEHHRRFKIAQHNYMKKWGLESL